jgi:deoxycytidine triphosphate deaminase
MFTNPKDVINNKWITHPDCTTPQHWLDNKFVSPNAIDFSLDELLLVKDTDTAYISNNKKLVKMKQLVSVHKITEDTETPFWELEGGKVYDGTSSMYVEVPEGYVCLPMFTRSTFARNGTFIMSGIFDSGYKGHIGFTIYTNGGPIDIEVGTRIGQIGFVKTEYAHLYDGGYSHEQGTHYADPIIIQPAHVAIGERQIQHNPARTEQGMGPILNTNSEFL